MDKKTTKILLVENDQDKYIISRDLLSEVKGRNYEIQRITSYQEALEAIGRNEHDVCLLDYCLDEHTGLEFLSEAIKNGCSIPIIILTGQEDREMDLGVMKAGAADYLVKGHITSSQLERSIRYTIERKRTEEALRKSLEELLKKHEELKKLFKKVEGSKKEWEKNMDCVGDMIMLTDSEGKIKRVNKAINEFTNKSYEEILGKHWTEIIYENDLEATNLYAGCAELLHRQTRKRYIFNAYPFKDGGPGSSGNAITIHDATAMKSAIKELVKSNRKIEDHREKLQIAFDEISSLIQNTVEQTDTGGRLSNPNLKKCYEIRNCDEENCSCHGRDALRCWQAAGTYCGGEIHGSFAQKYNNCLKCEVFKEATSDPVYQIGEQFNN